MATLSTYDNLTDEQYEYLRWLVDRLMDSSKQIPASVNMTEVQIIDTAEIIERTLKTRIYTWDEKLWLNSLSDIYIKLREHDMIGKPIIFSTGGEIGANAWNKMWEYSTHDIKSAKDFYKEFPYTIGVDAAYGTDDYSVTMFVDYPSKL
jgi:hypothetical protein